MSPGSHSVIILHKLNKTHSGQEAYRILFHYEAQEDDEISLKEGEVRYLEYVPMYHHIK